MRFLRFIPVLIAFLAPACAVEKPGPDVVASFESGTVSLETVEQRIRQTVEGVDQADRSLLVEAYRNQAKRIVVEQAILHRAAEADEADVPLDRIRRDVILELFKAEHIPAPDPISRQMVEAFFEEHEEDFHRQPRRFVWHIFRRHQDPAQPERTVAELAAIRENALAGHGFAQLAREHSQSETRLLGGRLGWIYRTKLPPSIEDVVFSLAKDEISAPIAVPGGAAIFMVSEVVPDTRLPLDDVRVPIHQRLIGDAWRQRIADVVGENEPPEDSVILDQEGFREATQQATPDDVLLAIESYRLTAGELFDLVTDAGSQFPGLPFFEPNPWQMYQDLALDQMLYLHAVEAGFPEEPDTAAEIEKRVRSAADTAVIDLRIEAALRRAVTEDRNAVEAFFETNHFLYQTPLRFKLWSLSLPLGDEIDRSTARIRSIRGAIETGTIDLPTAAAKIGADLVDLGWHNVTSLNRLSQKLSHYVLGIEPGGTTIPFQLNHRLNIILVEERQEPQPRPLAEVEDQVQDDYMERHKQQLYSKFEADLLRDVGFTFHEEAVLLALR
ncbi:MAG: peptidyl-prolyl cis-trans isomerase [Acidobacteria bacterium]|nr:peptidyl-prolyl cis-trans isomerase [Acidobacteriota bacterium]